MSIEYYLLPTTAHPPGYRAVLLRGRAADWQQFLRKVETSTTLSAIEVQAVIDYLVQWIVEQAAIGQEVQLGPLGHTRLGIRGQFSSSEVIIRGRKRHLTIGLELSRQLQEKVRRAALSAAWQRREPVATAPHVQSIVDLNSQRPDSYSPGGILELRGIRLKANVSREDEGVFFRRHQRDPWKKASQYVVVFPRRLQVIVPRSWRGLLWVQVRRRRRASQSNPETMTYPQPLLPAS